MIDLHTHILPNLDDGSSSVEESAAILNELKKQGVDTVVFTPHYYGKNRSVEEFLIQRQQSFERLKPFLPDEISVRLAAEVNIASYQSRNFDSLTPLAIEGTHYVMIEMPHHGEWTERLFDKISDLMSSTDLCPIIVHAEKFTAVQDKPSLLFKLIDMGCLIQATCDSFVKDKPLMRALIKHKQVHCLGSDSHNMSDRAPFYAAGVEELKKLDTAQAQAIQNNMRRILADENVLVSLDKPVKTFLGLYF